MPGWAIALLALVSGAVGAFVGIFWFADRVFRGWR